MHKFRYIFLIAILLFAFSCKKEIQKTELASVSGKKLYLEDIQDIIHKGTSKSDSLMILRNKVDLWVRKQTLLNRAEINLSENQKDIDYIVEEYRESLLIEKYKQEYIKQNLDTNITHVQIESYYNEYPESFTLNNDIVKAYYFKFKSNKNINTFKDYFLSNNDDVIEKLKEFALNNAEDYIDFSKNWIDLSIISNLLPISLNNAETVVNLSKRIHTRDQDFLYFVYLTDYKLKGQKMPLDFAEDKIKIIILNKRKSNLINKLENKIFKNAVKNGRIKIYIK